jgi:DnaD/phage-associated family protein
MENKTVLSDVGGFTPVIDAIVEDLGFISAGVFGVIWRYCQMSDGKCTASQSRLAEKLGVNVRTIQRCAEKLVTAGYLRVIVKKGVGVEYYDTGKAGLRIQISGYNNKISPSIITEAENSLRHRVAATYDTESQQPTTQSRTKIDIKKDLKDTTAAVNAEPNENLETAKVFKAYEQEIGMLTAFTREEVLDAIEHYPHDWIIEAIKEAAKNNVRKWSYARAILESWKVNGYKTDVRSKKQNGKSKQGGSKSYISPGLQKMLEEEKAERMRLYGGDDDE